VALTDMLARNAADSERPAMTFLDERGRVADALTWAELDRRVEALRAALPPLSPGSRALLLFDHGPHFATAFFACLKAGIAAVPLPPLDLEGLDRHRRYLASVIQDASCALILSHGALAEQCRARLAELDQAGKATLLDTAAVPTDSALRSRTAASDPDRQAALLYTSGSTSEPKGVALNARHLDCSAQACCESWGIDRDSVLVAWMPNHHSFGLIYNLLLPVQSGCQAVALSPQAFVRRPALWLETISRFRGTHAAAATFGYQRCIDRIDPATVAHLDLSCWQVGLVSAEPIRKGVYDDFMAKFGGLGLRPGFFCALYGLSESGPIASMPIDAEPVFRQRPGIADHLAPACVGRPMAGADIRCVSAHGRRCTEGEAGEIWISGPSVFEGYLGREAENARAFARLPGDPRRYFRTGDQGLFYDGALYVTGRLKEILIYRGKNFFPQDLEGLARQSHPTLRHSAAAAFSLEDEAPRIVMAIEIGEAADAHEGIARGAAAAIARNLGLPVDEIALMAEGAIPKTASGKIKRKACAAVVAAGGPGVLRRIILAPASTAPQADIAGPPDIETLKSLFAEVLRMPLEDIDEDQPLSAFQLDSVAVMELAQSIETRFGAPFRPASLFKCGTISDVAALVSPDRRVSGVG